MHYLKESAINSGKFLSIHGKHVFIIADALLDSIAIMFYKTLIEHLNRKMADIFV